MYCYNRNSRKHPLHKLLMGGVSMFFTRKHQLCFFGAVLMCVVCSLLFVRGKSALNVFSAGELEQKVFVLDAGHGGEDGGAVSQDGTKESDINLSVTLRLDTLLKFLGHKTVLTRDSDVSIYSDGSSTLRQKKRSDLQNRVSLVNAIPGAVLVSIHQNSMPSVPSVHGAQVFHGLTESSDELALSVQETLNRSVNTGNEKQSKKIDPSIYLMKKATCPAILVECGFLSNRSEADSLRTPEYQKQLSAAIAAGLLNTEEMP